MTLKEYYKSLTALLKDHPEAEDYQVVTSCDDEGNSFTPVVYTPNLGAYDRGEFTETEQNANAVCLN